MFLTEKTYLIKDVFMYCMYRRKLTFCRRDCRTDLAGWWFGINPPPL